MLLPINKISRSHAGILLRKIALGNNYIVTDKWRNYELMLPHTEY
jgi:hypothetical protein